MNGFKKQLFLTETESSDVKEVRCILEKIYSKVYNWCGKPYLRFTGAAVGVVALVWWCVLYPELCFPRDTYEAVYETDEVYEDVIPEADNENKESDSRASGVYPDILMADDEHIVIKSRLFEWLSQVK